MQFETFRYDPSLLIQEHPTQVEPLEDAKAALAAEVLRIREFQEVLFADSRYALLLIFQGMDCAGKDSTIKHVLSGVNPQGVHVANFKKPTPNELAHSYLWRYWRQMPQRGMIGVFNRSHYEEVTVLRVRPELFSLRRVPIPESLDEAFWQGRMEDLVAFEQHLTKNGVRIVKFFLHLSREEQKERLLARIDQPKKNWKFDPEDLVNRALWDEYQRAFQSSIAATHSESCPWYVIPADDKPTARALVAKAIADTLEDMPISIPALGVKESRALKKARKQLLED